MKKNPELYLRDILGAIRDIRRYVGGIRDEKFFRDRKTQDAVLRKFGIIGEAAARLPSSMTAAHPHIPWKSIIGMRNVLIHDYSDINVGVIWDTIQTDLSKLEAVIHRNNERVAAKRLMITI